MGINRNVIPSFCIFVFMKKKPTKKTPKKPRKNGVEKTRNGGKWTENQFWAAIRSCLRSKSRFWVPRIQCLEQARRPNQSDNKRLKWEFCCAHCNTWHPQKNIEVHHTVPAGSLKNYNDLPKFVENLFAETGWICLCKSCHLLEHKK